MLKQTAALLLLICFTAQTFSRLAMVGGYYANTSAYARNCENKAKPMLHCNGKCQLLKKMKQEEKKDQQNPERRNSGKEEVLSSKSFFASVAVAGCLATTHSSFYLSASPADQPGSIFHPPGA